MACEVRVAATIESYLDFVEARHKGRPRSWVRVVEVPDAIVDEDTLMLCLRADVIERLGLRRRATRRTRSNDPEALARIYDPVQLSIQGRDCIVEVMKSQGDWSVVVGRIPLTSMDWHVDSAGGRRVGNPAHGGRWMMDLFATA